MLYFGLNFGPDAISRTLVQRYLMSTMQTLRIGRPKPSRLFSVICSALVMVGMQSFVDLTLHEKVVFIFLSSLY